MLSVCVGDFILTTTLTSALIHWLKWSFICRVNKFLIRWCTAVSQYFSTDRSKVAVLMLFNLCNVSGDRPSSHILWVGIYNVLCSVVSSIVLTSLKNKGTGRAADGYLCAHILWFNVFLLLHLAQEEFCDAWLLYFLEIFSLLSGMYRCMSLIWLTSLSWQSETFTPMSLSIAYINMRFGNAHRNICT